MSEQRVVELEAENERLREENDQLKREMLHAAQISSTVKHARKVVSEYPGEFQRLSAELREAQAAAVREVTEDMVDRALVAAVDALNADGSEDFRGAAMRAAIQAALRLPEGQGG